MKDLLFMASDVWLIVTCFYGGWTFLRVYGNHLLGIEWLVVGTSATNFLVWSLLGGDPASPLYRIAYSLDAFSRSFGFTLVLVLGLMTVTHRYKPPLWVEIGSFALAAVAGVVFGGMHDEQLHVGLATFYVVTNLLTTVFLVYVITRLWRIGRRPLALWTAVVTAAATFIAITYDFFPLSFDDENRTIFYIAALTTWGTQALTYLAAYRALHDHNAAAGVEPARPMEAQS